MIKNFKLKNKQKEAVLVDEEDRVVVDDKKKKIRIIIIKYHVFIYGPFAAFSLLFHILIKVVNFVSMIQ